MQTIFLNELKSSLREPAVATIGFFDGVHLGHRHLVSQVTAAAHARQWRSMVITFDRHPREVLAARVEPFLLTTLDEKLQLLTQLGVDMVVVLPFSRQMATLSARSFMQSVLRQQLGVCQLVIGYDNRFGHDRTAGFPDYVAYGRELGIEVTRAEELITALGPVSSSVVRHQLTVGEVEKASALLGRPYELCGTVVHGFQEGRKMGFPTANLQLVEPLLLLPKSGVYAVETMAGKWMPGMLNIGTRPTFNGHKQTIEVHIFRFSGELYGSMLKVRLLHRVRDERPFQSPDELRRQLQHDRQEIETLLQCPHEQEILKRI